MLVWDDVGTCRAVNKHGASAAVSGGDGIRKREHVITMSPILNGMQRIRTVSLLIALPVCCVSKVGGQRQQHVFF